jgi:hypothetical protein
MIKWFRLKRDPVVLANLIATALMGLSDWFLNWDNVKQAALNAVVLAVFNLIAATRVHDGQLVALSGLAKAVIALIIGLGVKLNPDLQVMIMSGLAWVGSLYYRTQVAPDAPTPAAVAKPVVEVSSAVGHVLPDTRVRNTTPL